MMTEIPNIGSRLELFVDRWLVAEMHDVAFRLHAPHLEPTVLPMQGHYMTVFQDGDRYRAYYRRSDLSYTGELYDGNAGEATCYAESRDGVAWDVPDLGLCMFDGSHHNNVVQRMPPFGTNFAPFLDANPAVDRPGRYKALAGTHPFSDMPGSGLHAFRSADGIHWEMMGNRAVIIPLEYGLDSQNVSFWSVAEQRYVCFFRSFLPPTDGDCPACWTLNPEDLALVRPWTAMTEEALQAYRSRWTHPIPGRYRSISRTTSEDFIHWTKPVVMAPNLPGEHLYTNQTHPYFRAPHIYIALPTRFHPERGESTDILFMTTRAGSGLFDRLFTEAFIRPGLDPQRWGNRSNYAACGVVPTGPAEMSIYHGPASRRYTLRTDGFVSLHAGADAGTMNTRPFVFDGSQLMLNLSTSAAGGARVEMQHALGKPLPGRALADCPPIFTDAVAHTVRWRNGSDVSRWIGKPVRLHVELREADLYAVQFQ